jgi:hypothetical protein
VVLLVNTWAVMNSTNESSQVSPIQVANDQQLPDEYNVAVNTFYDYESPSINK